MTLTTMSRVAFAFATAFLSYPGLAGELSDASKQLPANPLLPSPSYFRDNEWSVGLFGSYLNTYYDNQFGIGHHAWGGGLEASYFYFKYLGISVDGDAFVESPHGSFGGTATGNLVLRLPLDNFFPNIHVAPYIFGGVGTLYSDEVALPSSVPGVKKFLTRTALVGDVGGGIEFRISPHLGVFADTRYNFTQNTRNEFMTTRLGMRYLLPNFGEHSTDSGAIRQQGLSSLGEGGPLPSAPLTASAEASGALRLSPEGKRDDQVPIVQDHGTEEHQNWAVHFDAIAVIQGQPGFHDPYSGKNSLHSGDNVRQTTDIDLFFGFRLWPGGELYFNAEYYQGFGLAITHGLAAFPNSEAYKVGKYRGDFFIPRIFFRQIWGFGGEQERIEADQLELAKKVDVSRLTLQIGKFSVTDVFDDNTYAHDPRDDFLNWAAIDAAAFDYAADSLGFEYGVSLDLNQKYWAARWGIFTVPRVSNGLATEGRLDRGWQQVAELEGRYSLFGHPGKVRLLGYLESANMGSYSAAASSPTLDLVPTRRYRLTYGLVLNFEQEITKDLGAFLRLGFRDPKYEVWQFIDTSKSLEIGLSLKGSAWKRPDDTVGLANMVDGLGHAQKRFFAAGGLGILVGDGRLPHYGLENVVETYYNFQVRKGINLTLDYQLAINPAYNEDRGPINIFSARLRFQF
jgi:high affinity Mn2+ porin